MEVAPVLSIIYRKSLQTCKVPKDWKVAHVSPIFKKGEHYLPSNYRPVSLTSQPCKILEHIVVSSIMKHWEANNILAPEQHGFRAAHSCETQLLELTEQLSTNLDKGLETDVIVLDFAKAFDKVNHSLLTRKIGHYGVRGEVNTWIADFLSERTQAVVVDGCKSDYIHVRSGVPQGSVLGPCLFLGYINDLPHNISSNTRLFADDTGLDRAMNTPADQEALQQDLCNLEIWERQWDMQFHPDKCKVLTVSRKRKKTKRLYTLHGHTLENVTETKYLGVTLQDDGAWNKHIAEVASKGNRLLGFLRRNLKIQSKQVKSRAYITLLRPTLEYASVVWDPYVETQIHALEMVQRRAARFVTRRYRNTSSVTEMLTDLNWPTLESRRKRARLCFLRKILHRTVSVKILPAPAPVRQRRSHDQQLEVLFSKKEYRKNAYFPRTIREWNSLSQQTISAPSHRVFAEMLSGSA